MSIAIVSDSACDLPKDILKKLNITEVPVNVTFGDKVYKENVDITGDEFYKKLPLKRANDGSIITLSDVARVELGAESTRTLFKGNGDLVYALWTALTDDGSKVMMSRGRLKS